MARAASTPEAPLPNPACSSKAMDKHLCGFWRWTLHAYCVEIQDLGFRVLRYIFRGGKPDAAAMLVRQLRRRLPPRRARV